MKTLILITVLSSALLSVGCGQINGGDDGSRYFDACPPGQNYTYDAGSKNFYKFAGVDGKNVQYRPGRCVDPNHPDSK